MPTNNHSDRQYLVSAENEDPPTYQDATAQGSSYGTFISPSPIIVAPVSHHQTPAVIVLGGCPSCRVGMLDTEFTCMGLCCAIFCFPIGILCCLALRQRRCNFCGAIFD